MRRIFIIIIVLMFIFAGCSYKDMNRLEFSTLGCSDINEKGEIVSYGEVFLTSRTAQVAGTEVRIIAKGSGKTLYDAFSLNLPNEELPVSYDITKAMIFTRRAAEKGLDIFLDPYQRDQKPAIKQYMFICEQSPEEILKVEIPNEKFLGFYLESFMVYYGNSQYIASIRINEFINNRHMGSQVNLVPIIKTGKQVENEKIEIDGAAVIVEDKMVSKLEKVEVGIYKYMVDKMMMGSIIIDNPMSHDGYISLIIINSNTKKDILIENDNEIHLNLSMHILVNINEVQGGITLTDKEAREQVKKKAEEKVKLDCQELFKKYQQQEIDLLNIKSDVMRKDARVDFDIKNVEMNIDVNVEIDGSGVNTNTNMQ
ncbi:MAG: Ger(x)C family spore germination protein [Eubacteriaceae bacterium]